ncbi:hypothetical protein WJX81_004744 [Elliptochloris bilobata]|uniref:3-ketoacyl-CoA synthase n=1 Tax=Elliptochloris bilobata TaxID=381761 RepID=A0AAW1S6D0_9CHLO
MKGTHEGSPVFEKGSWVSGDFHGDRWQLRIMAALADSFSAAGQHVWEEHILAEVSVANLISACVLLTAAVVWYVMSRARPVYLLDFHVYKPRDELKMSRAAFLQHTRGCKGFTPESITFQEKMVAKGGLGDETYLPDAVHAEPPCPTLAMARAEAEMVMFESVRQVLAACGVSARQVDILIVNCSLFNPTPSLASMIVNHFRMRPSIVTYNLSGMGCSAGLIAIGLAQELLQRYPRARAVVVSTENITQNWYFGNERSMLIPNCLFRVGGAGCLLSNRLADSWRAKYELSHVVRTHMGAQDASYGCVFQREDAQGQVGVHLSKELMAIAGYSLKANITTLGPLVLPASEQLTFLAYLFARKVLGVRCKAYLPDFSLAFEHFCIHTGGRGVLDELEKQLKLTPEAMAPSRAALHRYGNVSSSSIWYVLAQIETTQGVKRGDRVWQIAFGSGFKCNSAVWKARRTITSQHEAWLDRPHPGYPATPMVYA